MNRSEKAIEMVLAGLRDAEAPAGMERRVLKGVEQRTSALSTSSVGGWRPLWMLNPAASHATRPWAWGVALACVAAVSVAIGAAHFHGHFSAHSKAGRSVASGTLLRTSPERVDPDAHLPPRNPKAPVGASHQAALADAKLNMRASRRISVADQAMLAEMHAASHPAPEAPLTQQEKLLVRIVQSGDPQQMAMLNPEIRARQDAEREAEFQKFVDQSMGGSRE